MQPVQTHPPMLKRSLPSAPGSRSLPHQSLHWHFGFIVSVPDTSTLADSGVTSACNLRSAVSYTYIEAMSCLICKLKLGWGSQLALSVCLHFQLTGQVALWYCCLSAALAQSRQLVVHTTFLFAAPYTAHRHTVRTQKLTGIACHMQFACRNMHVSAIMTTARLQWHVSLGWRCSSGKGLSR